MSLIFHNLLVNVSYCLLLIMLLSAFMCERFDRISINQLCLPKVNEWEGGRSLVTARQSVCERVCVCVYRCVRRALGRRGTQSIAPESSSQSEAPRYMYTLRTTNSSTQARANFPPRWEWQSRHRTAMERRGANQWEALPDKVPWDRRTFTKSRTTSLSLASSSSLLSAATARTLSGKRVWAL